MFVPAFELYDPSTGTRRVHPSKEASDFAVWHAVEQIDPQDLEVARDRCRW